MTKDLPKLDWLRVRTHTTPEAVSAFLKKQRVNTYSPKFDKNNNPLIMLGWDWKPDSDWGKFDGYRAAIWFETEALAAQFEPVIRKALGFEVDSASGLFFGGPSA